MECFALCLESSAFAELSASAELALVEGNPHIAAQAHRIEGGAGLWAIAGYEIELGGKVWDPRPALSAAAAAIGVRGRGVFAERRIRLAEYFESRKPALGIHAGGAFEARFRELLAAEGAPAKLVGFGPGSTPAGDDFIAGYLLARHCLGEPTPAELGLDPSRTTAAGRSLLLQALAGGFPASYIRLAEAFASAEGPVETAAAELFAHGASSGADATAGFLHGSAPPEA